MTKHPPEGPFLTEVEVAAHLATTPRHVRQLRLDGRITYVEVGRFFRYTPDDLAAFIAARRVRASRA